MLSALVKDEDDTNLLINFTDLNSFISPKLDICSQCRKSKLELTKIMISGFCTGLEVTCQHCTVIESQQRHQLRHLNDKISSTRGKVKKIS